MTVLAVPSAYYWPRARLALLTLVLTSLTACSFGPKVEVSKLTLPPARVFGIERHEFPLAKDQAVVGQLASVPVEEGDSLLDIARHFGLGFQQISDANPGIDVWTPEAGSRALLPLRFVLPDAPRKGVVVNLASMRLFYYPGGSKNSVVTYPVGIGKEGRSTPTGQMQVERKTQHPTWYVPDSIRKDHELKGDPLPASVSPGPDNPLGDYAMYLSKPSYLIHGTNKPFSIGLRASNGCLRLYPEDIERLFKGVPEKTPVRIVNQPFLIGLENGQVYLEAHAPHDEMDDKSIRKAAVARLKQIEKKQGMKLDWPKVEETLTQGRGVPVPVGAHGESLADLQASALALAHPVQLHGQPPAPNPTVDAWYIRAAQTSEEASAQKIAAILNHQGPQIPARAVAAAAGYEVLAGPFKDAKTTKLMAKRMKIDLEIKGQIIEPAQRVSMDSGQ